MSDNYTDPEDGQNDEAGEDDFKNLRAKAKKADRLEPEVNQLKRENAFLKAGIPTDDPRMSYFVKGYDGDLDADAIRKAAVEAGFIQQQERQPDPAVVQAQQGQQRVLAAASESQPVRGNAEGRAYEMQQGMAQGGLAGLSAVTEKYGITFEER